MITVADIMTSTPVVIEPDSSLMDAVELMKSHACRQIPVMEQNTLVGIITDRDIRLAMNSPILMQADMVLLKCVTVRVVMTSNPLTITLQDSAAHAAKLLRAHKFGALPVMEDGRLVGIVTTSDILGNYITILEAQKE